VVNGYGISPADGGIDVRPAVENSNRKCWYVLDVQLCD
jgi:hypothetical protein